MSRRSIQNEPDQETDIDLSSMIDCIFILLIFFIVTTVFVEEPGVDIIKPDAITDLDLEKNSLIIAVTADNRVVYGGKEIGIAGVSGQVKQQLKQGEIPVIIQADVNAEHGVFSKVWTEVKNAGAQKISVSTFRN